MEEAAQWQRASSGGVSNRSASPKEGVEAVSRADGCSDGAGGAFLIVEVGGGWCWSSKWQHQCKWQDSNNGGAVAILQVIFEYTGWG